MLLWFMIYGQGVFILFLIIILKAIFFINLKSYIFPIYSDHRSRSKSHDTTVLNQEYI